MAIQISDKLGFMTKKVMRNNEGHFIMKRGSIHQENVTILNILVYAPNNGF